MDFAKLGALLVALVVLAPSGSLRADVGWSVEEYVQRYGPGERGFGKIPEVGFRVGDGRLVVEMENDRSIAEIWHLGVLQDDLPDYVLAAARAATAEGEPVEVVRFKADGALAAEIHEAVLDGILVRVDVRNQGINRVAFCGTVPECGWISWLLGRCGAERNCSILDRAIRIDHKVDRLHVIAEKRLPPR